MALNTSPLFNASLWVCGAMKQVKLLLFAPLSPKPLFCSIAPQTPSLESMTRLNFVQSSDIESKRT